MRYLYSLLLCLLAIHFANNAKSSMIVQITHEGGNFLAISGDGTKIGFLGQMVQEDPYDFKVFDINSYDVLLRSSRVGGQFLDYLGNYFIKGGSDTYILKINYEAGELEEVVGAATCFPEEVFSFPSICGSGAKASYLNSRFEDDGGCMEYGYECPCYDRTTIKDLASGSTVVIPGIMQPQISSDCQKVAGLGANGNIQLYSSEGSFINDLGVKGWILRPDFDASRIAFICEEGGVCTINSDGTGLVKWTDYPGYPPYGNWGNDELFISYDGSKILINKGPGEIMLLNTASGAIVNLTRRYPTAGEGRMSADGSSGVFGAYNSDHVYNIYYFNLADCLTPAGKGVLVDLGRGVTIVYSNVASEGQTDISIDDQGPGLPEGFALGGYPVYYHLETSAVYSGGVELCVNYDESSFGASESLIHLLQYTDGAWTDVTSSLDLDNNIICGRVASLSDFSIATGPSAWRPPAPARQKIFKGDGGDGLFCGFTGRRPGASSIFLILPLLIGLFLSRHLRAVWR